jgi:DNA-binding SARP family transcriptional activator
MKAAHSSEKIIIRTFGGLTVYRHHSPVFISWESQKARLLFCYLLIASDQWVHRDQLMELLWPGCDHDSGSRNFKTTLSRLRKSFQGARNLNPVISQGDAYRLNFESITCDNGMFREEAVSGIKYMTRGDVKGAREHLEKAQELYIAEFLPEEPSDAFIGEARREMGSLFTTVLNYLEQIYAAEERPDLLESLRSLSHFPAFQRT